MNIHDNTYHTNGNSSPLLTKPYFNASMNLHTDRAINGITNNRSQLDDESEQLSIHPVSMLIRKLVYNDKANLLFPKLVMFAKCDISAHSELIL